MKKKQEPLKKTELLIEYVDKLRKLQLPEEWEVAELDVKFRRRGFMEQHAEVIYDSRNNVFYVKTNKCIVYPGDEKALNEGLSVMRKANAVIKEPVIEKIK